MRFKELLEASTKERDKVELDLDLDGPKSKGDLSKIDRTEEKPSAKSSGRKTASAASTRSKTANAKIDPTQVPDADLSKVNTDHEIDDLEALHRAGIHHDGDDAAHHDVGTPELKPTSKNLPAIISKALATMGRSLKGISPDDVEWHMVKHLPGYLSKPIRAMGRQVFSPFTKTPIEDIQVIASLGGAPNTDAEIDAVSKYVSKNGHRDHALEVLFTEVIPGYNAHVIIYDCLGYTFCFVKDFAGNYIYSWPSSDTRIQKQRGHEEKLSGGHARLGAPPKQLTHDQVDDINDLMKKYGI